MLQADQAVHEQPPHGLAAALGAVLLRQALQRARAPSSSPKRSCSTRRWPSLGSISIAISSSSLKFLCNTLSTRYDVCHTEMCSKPMTPFANSFSGRSNTMAL